MDLASFKNIDFVLLMEVLGGSNSVVECQLPKLDVAGSTPVSRSIFSTTWEGILNGLLQNAPLSALACLQRGFE